MEFERISHIPTLAPRPADSHKGMFGSILIVGGSRGMAGAAALAGASALRSGAGRVRIASAAEVSSVVAQFEPSYMTWPLAGTMDGVIDFPASQADLSRLLAQCDVLAVGPGLGQGDTIKPMVTWLIEEGKSPIVLDADALNALVGRIEILSSTTRPIVLTPHPGEMARLLGTTVSAVEADREQAAMALAVPDRVVVLLKGAHSIITDGRRLYVNKTGNPGMATGGSGDVLTGVISALLGQKLSAFEAAQLGAHVHGLAGNIARDQNGEVGLIAGDLVDSLPDAFDLLQSL
jgi:hydroxyethylthiazole kinase-like uncharacterized protein yjeF